MINKLIGPRDRNAPGPGADYWGRGRVSLRLGRKRLTFDSMPATRITVAFCLLLSIIPSHSQWTPASGPTRVIAEALAIGGSQVYAGSSGGGFLRSTDLGGHWLRSNAGLTNTRIKALQGEGPDAVLANPSFPSWKEF